MGLFNSAFNLFGKTGQSQSMQDPASRLLQSALALISDNGQNGGLNGLVSKFQEAGLGNVINSWIGPGENLPISGEQMQQALGVGEVDQISEETGMSREETANHLSELLPQLVNRLTPNGRLPQGGFGEVGELLEQVLGRR